MNFRLHRVLIAISLIMGIIVCIRLPETYGN